MERKQSLAQMRTDRRLYQDDEQNIYLEWEQLVFPFTRPQFAQWVAVLEQGQKADFAERGPFTVVWEDATRCEVWINNRCLGLTQTEYKKLVNAALRTETRLHGTRSEAVSQLEPLPAHIELKLVATVRPVKVSQFSRN